MDETKALRRVFQKFIDSKSGRKSDTFTIDGAAYYHVTPEQRRILMRMAPQNIRDLNNKA